MFESSDKFSAMTNLMKDFFEFTSNSSSRSSRLTMAKIFEKEGERY
jgi:hypothetical protein